MGDLSFLRGYKSLLHSCDLALISRDCESGLQEIGVTCAKGYRENIDYVKAARKLPKLTGEEIKAKAAEYGFHDPVEEAEKGTGLIQDQSEGT